MTAGWVVSRVQPATCSTALLHRPTTAHALAAQAPGGGGLRGGPVRRHHRGRAAVHPAALQAAEQHPACRRDTAASAQRRCAGGGPRIMAITSACQPARGWPGTTRLSRGGASRAACACDVLADAPRQHVARRLQHVCPSGCGHAPLLPTLACSLCCLLHAAAATAAATGAPPKAQDPNAQESLEELLRRWAVGVRCRPPTAALPHCPHRPPAACISMPPSPAPPAAPPPLPPQGRPQQGGAGGGGQPEPAGGRHAGHVWAGPAGRRREEPRGLCAGPAHAHVVPAARAQRLPHERGGEGGGRARARAPWAGRGARAARACVHCTALGGGGMGREGGRTGALWGGGREQRAPWLCSSSLCPAARCCWVPFGGAYTAAPWCALHMHALRVACVPCARRPRATRATTTPCPP